MANKPATDFTSQPSVIQATKSSCKKSGSGWCACHRVGGRLVKFTSPPDVLHRVKYFPPLGGEYISTSLWGSVPPATARRDFVMKNELENNLRKALDELGGGHCTNSHCFKDTCKGECERTYHYQALRIIRNGIDQAKRLGKPTMGQKQG